MTHHDSSNRILEATYFEPAAADMTKKIDEKYKQSMIAGIPLGKQKFTGK